MMTTGYGEVMDELCGLARHVVHLLLASLHLVRRLWRGHSHALARRDLDHLHLRRILCAGPLTRVELVGPRGLRDFSLIVLSLIHI